MERSPFLSWLDHAPSSQSIIPAPLVAMANALRSEFLGKALQRSEMSSAKAAERVQTQALFNKKTTKTATKQVKKVEQKAKSALPQLNKLKKAVPQLQKKAGQAQKSVTKQAKKATSGKSSKGWFGGAGGASDLDKWYGECTGRLSCLRTQHRRATRLSVPRLVAGPSRALFLPGGLLDPSDVPSYLNGSLAGE